MTIDKSDRKNVPQGVRTAHWQLNMPPELVVLTFLAAVTRLAAITHPRAIVFDEVYFRDAALRYLHGSYYFDLHPPLGKLLLAGWARLFGSPLRRNPPIRWSFCACCRR